MHNVASATAGFESDYAKAGTFSFTFNNPGTYYYLCEVHPTAMKGVVQVQ